MTFYEDAELFRKDFGKVFTQSVEAATLIDPSYSYFNTEYMIGETTEKILGIMEKLTLSFPKKKSWDDEFTIFNDINLALTIEGFLRKYGFKLELSEIVKNELLVRFIIKKI